MKKNVNYNSMEEFFEILSDISAFSGIDDLLDFIENTSLFENELYKEVIIDSIREIKSVVKQRIKLISDKIIWESQ